MKKTVIWAVILTMSAVMLCACKDDEKAVVESTAAKSVVDVNSDAERAVVESNVIVNNENDVTAENVSLKGDDSKIVHEDADAATSDADAATSDADAATSDPDETEDTVTKASPDIVLTIPYDYVEEGITQEQLDEKAAAGGYVAILNDDGSITYQLKKEKQEELLREKAQEIEGLLDGIVESDEYPSYKEIIHNGDFTEFTVKCSTSDLGMKEALSVMALYMYGGEYNAYNGNPEAVIQVIFVSTKSGQVLSRTSSDEELY